MPKRMINSSRWQKQATVMITKKLDAIAREVEKDAAEVVKDKLLETYKNNVLASYTPRSEAGLEVKEYNEYQKAREAKSGYATRLHRKKLTYRQTNTFLNAIKAEIQGKYVKILIDGTATYKNGKPVTEVYEYLTEGTRGGDTPYQYETREGDIAYSKNYPTPKHLFEEHTKEQMKGFLESFKGEILNSDKYKSRKYNRKKGASR